MVCLPIWEENLMAHKKKVTWNLCVYIISDTIHYPKMKRGKRNHKSTLANISDKIFTKRTDQKIRTQINILFQFLIYTYFCLGWIKIKTFPKCHCQMLVLALERATDGHDSLDCQMALENIQIQISNGSQHSESIIWQKEITIMRKVRREHFNYSNSPCSLTSSIQ